MKAADWKLTIESSGCIVWCSSVSIGVAGSKGLENDGLPISAGACKQTNGSLKMPRQFVKDIYHRLSLLNVCRCLLGQMIVQRFHEE